MEITTIDEYIGTFPADVQAILEKVRQAIRKAAPEAVETMSYGMPTFNLNGKHLVFFAGWKHHISLYPLPAGDEVFQQKIAQYKRVKSTIQFRLESPIPYDLVEKIVTLLMMEKSEKES
ncbi:MAG: iron chaperone [Ktedonobacteraceae bacterium]